MQKKTRSFHYAAGAISTSKWKGVPLSELLKHCGVNEEAKYVCFEGADELPFGKYGTSIPLEWAMDKVKDIIVAFEMNGKRLPPDHGFPIRLVCPGMAGARCVKWLKKIIVSKVRPSLHP
jgi:DMSO/TMAO reductase YedYZ molybdopterin-dependent catalytic subunit